MDNKIPSSPSFSLGRRTPPVDNNESVDGSAALNTSGVVDNILSYLPISDVPQQAGVSTLFRAAANRTLATQQIHNLPLIGEENEANTATLLRLIMDDRAVHELRLSAIERLRDTVLEIRNTDTGEPIEPFIYPHWESYVALATHQAFSPEMQAIAQELSELVLPSLLAMSEFDALAALATHPQLEELHAQANAQLIRLINEENRLYLGSSDYYREDLISLRQAVVNSALPMDTQQALQALLERIIPDIYDINYDLLDDVINDARLPTRTLNLARERQSAIFSEINQFDLDRLEELTNIDGLHRDIAQALLTRLNELEPEHQTPSALYEQNQGSLSSINEVNVRPATSSSLYAEAAQPALNRNTSDSSDGSVEPTRYPKPGTKEGDKKLAARKRKP